MVMVVVMVVVVHKFLFPFPLSTGALSMFASPAIKVEFLYHTPPQHPVKVLNVLEYLNVTALLVVTTARNRAIAAVVCVTTPVGFHDRTLSLFCLLKLSCYDNQTQVRHEV